MLYEFQVLLDNLCSVQNMQLLEEKPKKWAKDSICLVLSEGASGYAFYYAGRTSLIM